MFIYVRRLGGQRFGGQRFGGRRPAAGGRRPAAGGRRPAAGARRPRARRPAPGARRLARNSYWNNSCNYNFKPNRWGVSRRLPVCNGFKWEIPFCGVYFLNKQAKQIVNNYIEYWVLGRVPANICSNVICV